MRSELSRNQRRRFGLLFWVALLSVGSARLLGSERPGGPTQAAQEHEVVAHYAALVERCYQDALIGARQLQAAIQALVEDPSEHSLEQARQAWLQARVPYLQTEVCRFYDGPIDEVEGMINAWPIDENYVDYVADNPNAGIINASDQYPVLTRELISSLNEKEGQKNISAGYHAIEFLLWGQDQSASGPGARSWRDYAPGARHWDRRGLYLRLTAELLVEKLSGVVAAWREGESGNYRAQFLALPTDIALGRILKGMGVLSGPELSGERLTVAYETKEQEDEHSCFSDNTCNDLIYDALGIENVYFGCYERLGGPFPSGPGIHDLLQKVDPPLARKLAAQIKESVAAVRAIPSPFDQAILSANGSPARIAVKRAATALQTQSELIAQAAKALQIKL